MTAPTGTPFPPRPREGDADTTVALVQEWIAAPAGSEKVFAELAACVPTADLVALSATPRHGVDLGGRPVRTTALDRPLVRERRGLTLPVMPAAWRMLGEETHDWAVVNHHAFAASSRLAPPEHTLVYVHSPARYVWYPDLDDRGAARWLAPARAVLKRVDRRAARRPGWLAANSSEIRQRIQDCWGRDAVVLHPPVDTEWFAAEPSNDTGPVPPGHAEGAVLFVGRWIPYKRPDLAIRLGEKLRRPVVVVGHGPLEAELRAMAARATVPVHVIARPDDDLLRTLYARAGLLVFLGREDFGIVPVEAMAAGTPVLALDAGGARDTVRPGESGHRVADLQMPTLVRAADACAQVDPADCREVATHFSVTSFRQRFRAWCLSAGMPGSLVRSSAPTLRHAPVG